MTATSRRTAKNNRFRLTKQQHCTCITLFCTFLCRHYTTTTWKYLISRFVEEVNTRQRLSFFFSWTLMQSFRIQRQKKISKICRIEWDRISVKKFEAARLHFFKWLIPSRRRRCCLSSIAKTHSGLTTAVTFSRLTDAGSRARFT